MIILDTDHLTILRYREHPRCQKLQEKLRVAASTERISTTIISADEQLSGWLGKIHHERDAHQQAEHYRQFEAAMKFFIHWDTVLFDIAAADRFLELKRQRLRLGTQDLKIASIALTRDALLLSANLRDFSRVPGLRFENWLE